GAGGAAAAYELAKRCPHGLDKVFLLLSGSDAVEAALKTARQYWSALGKPEKKQLFALTPSYHGSSLLALSASGRPEYQKTYKDWIVDVVRVPAPYPYRCLCRGNDPVCPACTGTAIEQRISEAGPENIAAIIIEPIGGSSTGCSVPRLEFMRNLRAACDKHDVLLIADEVLTGAGRTGTWSALEHYGVV
ncbi:MAG: aspartate aminotransferase family protein, partial [Bradyrhizobium sp.]|nr:aspartate aminotransferase family protein [Bradyrhizobium sp.]